MSTGRAVFEYSSGGGSNAPGAQELSRQLVLLGVSAGGTIETLYKPQSEAAILSTFGRGPLAEALLYCLVEGAPPPMGIALNPSAVGGVSAVTLGGAGGAGTITVTKAPWAPILIYCVLGGTITTAKFKFSLDGGATWSATLTSVDSGGGSYVVRVPGTFTTLTFAAATYVIDKTCTVSTAGVVTNGSGWVGVVTQASSPLDVYDVIATASTGGGLGAAILDISLDGGRTSLPSTNVPSTGVVVIPGTGLVLTCASTFSTGATYSFLAAPPGYSASDITNAVTALRNTAGAPTSALLVLVDNSSTVAGGFTAAQTLDSAIALALSSNDLEYQGRANICCSEGAIGGDIVVSAGTAARATSADSAAIRTAREGITLNRTGTAAGAHRIVSKITGWQQQRPTNWLLAKRYAQTTPKVGVANRQVGPLDIAVLGRDELTASTSLHDVQVDTLQTIRGETGAWLTIQSNGLGFRNLNTDAQFQDADFMRVVYSAAATLRPVMNRLVGQRPQVNADGTIEEKQARRWDELLNRIWQRGLGLQSGGAFDEPQVSDGGASVDRSSQLGTSPRELVVQYDAQALGFVSTARGKVRVSSVKE